MRLFYGADPARYDPADEVELKVLRTLRMSRRAVYDSSGQDVLCTEVEIEVIAVLNPAATSYAGEVGVGPIPRADQRAVATDRAIRHRMMEQRRLLRFVSDEVNEAAVSRVLLQSPAPVLAGEPYTCDVKGGPYPQDFHVIAFHGIPKTMAVYYRTKTYVNECAQSENNVVLSHRWRQRVDIDADHFAVRVTEGEVVFDVAELTRRGLVPDSYRSQFFHPVPANFQRDHVNVTITEDGSRALYQTVDREKSHVLNANIGATRIEGYHTEYMQWPSPHLAQQVGFRAAMAAAAHAAEMGGANAGSLPFDIAIAGVDTLLAGMPTFRSHVFVRLWGNRDVARQRLADIAIAVAFGRLSDNRMVFAPTFEASLTRDLYGKFVEVQLTLTHPPSTLSLFNALAAPAAFMNDNEFLGDPFGLGVVVDPGDGVNPALPNDNASRGTWIGALLTQLLEAPCAAPSEPTNNPPAVARA